MDRLLMICSKIIKLRPKTTNLELQKYLYFIQAAALVVLEKEAFDDEIEAWQYGPVVPKAYKEFKYNKKDLEKIQPILDKDIENLVKEVVSEFGEDSAFELVERTHSYSSWIEAWRENKQIISKEDIIVCHNEIAEQNDGVIF